MSTYCIFSATPGLTTQGEVTAGYILGALYPHLLPRGFAGSPHSLLGADVPFNACNADRIQAARQGRGYRPHLET